MSLVYAVDVFSSHLGINVLFSRLDDNVIELGANNLFFAFSDSLFICRFRGPRFVCDISGHALYLELVAMFCNIFSGHALYLELVAILYILELVAMLCI